jgi:phage terminase small subunit
MNAVVSQVTESAVPAIVDAGKPLSNTRHERFAQLVAGGSSHTSAYREAGYSGTYSAIASHAHRLAADPRVQARISSLCRVAAASATFDVQARMHALLDIAEADPSEIARVVRIPCRLCWPAEAIAAAIDAAATTDAPMPDTDAPRPDCQHGPHERVELTPTTELSGRARRLLKGVRQRANGEIEVMFHDQLAASAQLSELAGWKVERNLNLNADVSASAALPPATPESVLAAFHHLRAINAEAIQQSPAAAPVAQLASIVAEQPTAALVADAEPRESRVIVAEYDD